MAKKEETPSPLMYTFVILVFVVGATFAICHDKYVDKQNNKELVGKTEGEQHKIFDDKLIKEYGYTDKELDGKSIEWKEKRVKYEIGEDSNGLVTAMIMVFFVLIAIFIAIFKFIATAVFGLRSLNNIRRNL